MDIEKRIYKTVCNFLRNWNHYEDENPIKVLSILLVPYLEESDNDDLPEIVISTGKIMRFIFDIENNKSFEKYVFEKTKEFIKNDFETTINNIRDLLSFYITVNDSKPDEIALTTRAIGKILFFLKELQTIILKNELESVS